MDPSAGLVFAADGATVAAAAFNAAWLFDHWLRRSSRASTGGRRLAAVTLAILNAGIAVQAAFAQALFTAHRFDLSADRFYAPGVWIASRALLLAGTLLLSLLIIRRSPQ